jgi:hypothetical protein
MMGIWYSMSKKDRKYFKFIMFNSGKVKIVSNDSIKKSNQNKFIFKDGANFLDSIVNLFKLDMLDLSELTQWIINEY